MPGRHAPATALRCSDSAIIAVELIAPTPSVPGAINAPDYPAPLPVVKQRPKETPATFLRIICPQCLPVPARRQRRQPLAPLGVRAAIFP